MSALSRPATGPAPEVSSRMVAGEGLEPSTFAL